MPSRSFVSCCVLVACLVAACHREPSADRTVTSPSASSPAPTSGAAAAPSSSTPPTEARAPLAGFPSQVELAAPADSKDKTRLGVVAVPLRAKARRPLVIALHGGQDKPEWACAAWRVIAEEHAFVVCPRGPGSEAALGWSSPEDTKMRVDRAVAATRATFGDWIAEGPTVLVGFSMGATQAAYLAESDPVQYPRVVLAESSYAPGAANAFSRRWAKGGGERAIFLCTTPGCPAIYRAAAKNVARNHLPARLNDAKTTSHGMWAEVMQSMRRDWPWLVEGTRGWEGYVAPTPAGLPGKTEVFAAE